MSIWDQITGLGTGAADTFNEALSFGSEWTETWNSPKPADVQAQQDQVNQAAAAKRDAILADAGVPGTTFLSSDQILAAWKAAGIDTSVPEVQSQAAVFADNGLFPDGNTAPAEQNAAISGLGATFITKYPRPISTYQQALTAYGLGDINFDVPRSPLTTENSSFSLMHGAAASLPEATKVPKGKPYVIHNGVYFYANGVIADPNSSSPIYPISKKSSDIAGSPVWVNNAVKSWSASKVDSWRTQLKGLGYDISKKGGWDQSLIDATNYYYASKYMHGGTVVPFDSKGGAGSGTTRTPPLDLHQLHASIQSQVQQQYQSLFGQDPTAAELKSWTSFIINTGMQLQQGGQRTALSPDAALGEAEARAARQITNSPVGSTWIDNQQENMTLHNALTSAIAATRGLA